ncbi:MAG: helix-turn-helix domain-containing protein [Chloroflexota bacterium]
MQSATEVGNLLRRTREEKGLSPDQVQAETKIRLRYLEALESGDESIIPGEVYYKGFLRFYANHLGLDGHALVEQYKQWKDSQRSEQERAAEADARVAARPRRVSVKRPGRLIAVLLLVMALAAGGIWGVSIYRQRAGGEGDNPPVVTGPDSTDPGTTPGGSESGGDAAPVVEVVKEDLGTAGLRYRATGSSVKVEVEAFRLCWVRVTADGVVIFENDLAPGAKAVWEARSQLRVLYGNLGGVKFSVNGVPQDIAGKDGDVRTVTYEPK